MKVLIADDEPLARQRLRRLLADCVGWEVSAEAGDGDTAWALCQQIQPDLLILDIHMPGLDGLQLAHKLATLDPPPAIIFSTAHAEHALHAFQTPATAYLLKPVDRAKLRAALDKVQSLTRVQTEGHAGAMAEPVLLVQRGGRTQRIAQSRIVCIRASAKLSEITHLDGTDLTEASLVELETRFPALLRVHRQALVQPSHVRSLVSQADGSVVLELDVPVPPVPVSRRLLPRVRSTLKVPVRPVSDPPTMSG